MSEPIRFVGLDISKNSVMVAAVDVRQQTVLAPKKIPVLDFPAWAKQHLGSGDAVVLEATTNAWFFHDQLQPLVAEVKVANPVQIKLIAQAKVKTDAKDALNLARLLAANLIPEVWVPPLEVRELRALITHRTQLIRQRTQARNRLHALLMTHQLLPPEGNLFSEQNRSWWTALAVSTTDKLLVQQQFEILAGLAPLLGRLEAEITRLSTAPYWNNQSTFLIQLPGIGILTAMTILSAIGQVSRFASAKALVGYSGLAAGVYASGQVYRTGSITRQGRVELRTALVEAAWIAVEQKGHWQEQFARLSARIGKGKAIVAIARKLLVVIWNVLTKEEADREADETRIGRKFLNWAYELKREGRQGFSGREFVQKELLRLGLGRQPLILKKGKFTLEISPIMVSSSP